MELPLNLDQKLFCAVKIGNVVVARQLISIGANVDAVDPDGRTCLHYTLQMKRGQRIIKLLLDSGADPNKFKHCDMSPLCLAVANGKLIIVKYLIDAGAIINLEMGIELQNRTALHVAVERGRTEIVQMLLEYGANVNAVDTNGFSVLLTAIMRKKKFRVTDEAYIDNLRLLLARGADTSEPRDNIPRWHQNYAKIQYRKPPMPLGAVLQYGNVEALKLFLDQGLDLRRVGPRHYTDDTDQYREHPTHRALLNPDTSVLKYLLDQGICSVAEKDYNGIQALHKAVTNKLMIPHAKVLLKRGADPNALSRGRETPLSRAIMEECIPGMQLLLEYDADINQKGILGIHDIPYLASTCRNKDNEVFKCFLKTIAIWVGQGRKIDHLDIPLFSMKNPRHMQYFFECENELLNTKKYFVYDPLSYFNLLSSKDLSPYTKDDRVINALINHSELIKSAFPIYGGDLCQRFILAYKKSKLRDEAKKKLSSLIGLDIDNHHKIFQNILRRLRKKDLQSLANV